MQQKKQYTPEEKHQLVADWRASGLTRQQFCDLNNIRFSTFRKWPRDTKLNASNNNAELLPLHISTRPVAALATQTVSEPVMLYLPGGIRMSCHPSQLADVFLALKHADA